MSRLKEFASLCRKCGGEADTNEHYIFPRVHPNHEYEPITWEGIMTYVAFGAFLIVGLIIAIRITLTA